MKSFCAWIALFSLVLTSGASAAPRTNEPVALQSVDQPPSASPATLVRIDGVLKTEAGAPRSGSVVLVVSLYADKQDVTPLWLEQQLVTLDQAGQYAIFAGATLADGLPQELLTSGAGRWLGVAVQGEAEHQRIMLVSVPYALKAREADTLSGKSATAFVLAENLKENVRSAFSAAGANGEGGGGGILSGTVNKVAKFDATGLSSNTVDSSIFDNGTIGIGTTSPRGAFDVIGRGAYFGLVPLAISYAGSGYSSIGYNFVGQADTNTHYKYLSTDAAYMINFGNNNRIDFSTAGIGSAGNDIGFQTAMTITGTGNVGVQNTNPRGGFDFGGRNAYFGAIPVAMGYAGAGYSSIGYNFVGQADSNNHWKYQANDVAYMVNFGNNNRMEMSFAGAGLTGNDITWNTGIVLTGTGNVGIGTAAPSTKFHVAGDVMVTGNIAAKYQDVAEWVETDEPLEAGTVVIVDPMTPDHVKPAHRAYDTRVAGAVSRQPGLVLGERSDTKAMVAQSGRVKVKADAKYGAIRIGDLLVTSPTTGHVMRSRPMKVGGGQSMHRPGTLVGKALEPLAKGKGEILVLLTLQ